MSLYAILSPILGMPILRAVLILSSFCTTLRAVGSDHKVSVFVFIIEIFHVTDFGCQVITVKNNIHIVL